jgi:hypothetical protein
MPPRTTSVELKGDRDAAKQLAHAHLERLLYNFRDCNKQKLPIHAQRVNFFDHKTGRQVAEVYMQTVHGAENVIITCLPQHRERKEELVIKREESYEQIVPCFLVTGEAQGSEQILGYVVCLSGSFLPPYQWFPIPDGDTEVVLEAFYHEGFEYYNEDVSFRHARYLSSDPALRKTLYYFKPSGKAPDPSRASESDEYSGGPGREEYCGEVEFYDGEDSTYVWSTAMSLNAVGGGSASGWSQTFDGLSLFPKYELSVTYSGEYFIQRGRFNCSSLEDDAPPPASCFTGRTEWKATEEFPTPCPSENSNTVAFDSIQTGDTSLDEFLEDDANGSIRLNDAITSGAYLVDTWTNYAVYHRWRNDIPIPNPYSSFTSNSPCEGCYDDRVTNFTALLLVVDTTAYNITARFNLPSYSRYRSIGYGNNLVYHKQNDASPPRALAAAKSGPYVDLGMVYDVALYNYVGPYPPELEGSVLFPFIDNDHSIVPDVINVPDDIICRVRGHVFFGILRTEVDDQETKLL